MKKFIFVGDPHIRGTSPRNRTDDYNKAWKAKFHEIWDLAMLHKVEAVILAGDIFHTPDVANSVLNDAADVMNDCPVPIYTPVGNHDIPGYNLQAYSNTSLRLLERMVDKFHVVTDPTTFVLFGYDDKEPVQITFTSFSSRMDVDGYGYNPENKPFTWKGQSVFRIHVAHGMLLDHEPPFDRYTLLQNVATTADVVLTGHDHTGYGVYTRKDGVIFCNPGSLTRMSASETEITRPIQVALLSVNRDRLRDNMPACEIELIPLKSAKPGPEVLDRSRIEADQKRQYAMEEFAALVQSSTGERVLLDVNQIIESIAQQDGIDPKVLELALERVEAARMGVKN